MLAVPDSLHVLSSGTTGPTVVLVHGSLDRAAGLARVTRQLGERRVVRYDRRGYGRSVGGAAGIDTHVDDLLGLLDPDDGPAIVVGHSFGGLVALSLAHRPGVAGVLGAVGAYEPPSPWHPRWRMGIERWADDPARAAEQAIAATMGPERWAHVPVARREARCAEGVAMVAEMRSMMAPDVVARLVRPPVPVRLAHGTATGRHHVAATAALARHLDVPLDRIEGADHRAPMTRPAEFARWVELVVAGATLSVEPSAGAGTVDR